MLPSYWLLRKACPHWLLGARPVPSLAPGCTPCVLIGSWVLALCPHWLLCAHPVSSLVPGRTPCVLTRFSLPPTRGDTQIYAHTHAYAQKSELGIRGRIKLLEEQIKNAHDELMKDGMDYIQKDACLHQAFKEFQKNESALRRHKWRDVISKVMNHGAPTPPNKYKRKEE